MADFLWHKVSEKEKEEIKKQAKSIIDSFSKKLSKVGEIEEGFVEREEFERVEGKGECSDIDKGVMLKNAPKSDGDFVIGEKGGWK